MFFVSFHTIRFFFEVNQTNSYFWLRFTKLYSGELPRLLKLPSLSKSLTWSEKNVFRSRRFRPLMSVFKSVHTAIIEEIVKRNIFFTLIPWSPDIFNCRNKFMKSIAGQ